MYTFKYRKLYIPPKIIISVRSDYMNMQEELNKLDSDDVCTRYEIIEQLYRRFRIIENFIGAIFLSGYKNECDYENLKRGLYNSQDSSSYHAVILDKFILDMDSRLNTFELLCKTF